jgi:hypothetical protein
VYYRHHLAVTDQVCDSPTVRMLKFILIDEEEHIRWGQAIYEELADTPPKRRRAMEWQTHLEELLAAIGRTPEDVPPEILRQLPATLRDAQGEATVTTFGRRVIAAERGDTSAMKFGLAVDIGTTSVVTTLIELESGEQLASVSSLNPQAVFGGDLMSRIAFAQFWNENLDIYVVNADGSGLIRLTDHLGYDVSPAWSPDGRRVAFTSERDGKGEIYAMNADGSGLTRLTNHPAEDYGPVWSPTR